MVKGCYERTCFNQGDPCPDLPSRDGTWSYSLRPEICIQLRRESFYLWMFIAQEGLLTEAREFMEENMAHPAPSEYGRLP